MTANVVKIESWLPEEVTEAAPGLSSLLNATLEHAPFGVCLMRADGVPFYINRKLSKWVDRSLNKLLNQPMAEIIHHADRAVFACALRRVLSGHQAYRDIEVRLRAKTERWVLVSLSPMRHETEMHVIVQMTDITRRKRAEGELVRLARRDHLTGLANRRSFEEEMRRAVKSAQRHGRTGAVLYVDLDDFKSINDTFGHKVGDLILQRVAKVLEQTFRETDTVARIGGDEFAIIMEEADERECLEKVKRVQTSVSGIRISVDGKHVVPQASVGCQPFDGRSDTCMDQLMTEADRAMYRNKGRGKAASNTRRLNA